MRFAIALLTAFTANSIGACTAIAQISDDIVRIGVLNDQSGLYADLGGPGSVVAARMAVEDAGGTVLGKPVDVVFADHQNKADIGAAIAHNGLLGANGMRAEQQLVHETIGLDDMLAIGRRTVER